MKPTSTTLPRTAAFVLGLARHAQGLVAVNAVASLAATHPPWKNFVEELWNTSTPDGLERYYEGLLYMMALLHCSGEFRIW